MYQDWILLCCDSLLLDHCSEFGQQNGRLEKMLYIIELRGIRSLSVARASIIVLHLVDDGSLDVVANFRVSIDQ